ncbi:MAG: guanitoxin biosynthesis heme-dependent pre-guanitoxin N-hydroxylase GntA, partial [Dokdonella sp.]
MEAKLRSQNSEPARDEPAVRAFKAFIRRKSYPCLGAKSALSRGRLTCFCGHDITQPNDDEHIADKVQSLALDTHHDDVFVSLAVLFPGSPMLSEIAFEQALWQRLRAINAIDRLQHGWDSSVSDDPQSRHFSMSVGGKGFFVVGLHPGASRLARRFQCPAMVFNLHSQFDRLRAEGRYEKLRGAIGERDVAFSGSRNPMLAAFGQRSEARQYSGRCLDEDWECPF